MKLKAIMWFIFSGTATLCAFFLPGFFWTTIISAKYGYGNIPAIYPTNVIFICFLILLIFGAIFHALYRIPVFITDLGFSKTSVLISKIICICIFTCYCVLMGIFFSGSIMIFPGTLTL